MGYVRPQAAYDVKSRRISGTRDEKLEQIDTAIQELLDIKTLECVSDKPNVRFLDVPRARPHPLAVAVTIILLLAALVLVLGVHAARAQASASTGGAGSSVGVSSPDLSRTENHPFNDPANHLFRTRGGKVTP
jgi:hypothetical protein